MQAGEFAEVVLKAKGAVSGSEESDASHAEAESNQTQGDLRSESYSCFKCMDSKAPTAAELRAEAAGKWQKALGRASEEKVFLLRLAVSENCQR